MPGSYPEMIDIGLRWDSIAMTNGINVSSVI